MADPTKKCCAFCFGDLYLRKVAIPNLSAESGRCSFCSTDGQQLVEPTTLRDHFELLISIYTLDEQGKSLVEWFKEDWAMFNHAMMDVAHSKELLAEILNDGEIIRQNFKPSELCHTDSLIRWEKFRDELMHENRFFPKMDLKLQRLREMLSYLILDEDDLPGTWYRARLQKTEDIYPNNEMGAPPKHLASHGRANPAGIPYLYLASTTTTAISEIRPHTGEIASVANFSLPENLKIVDLRHPRKTVSPFVLADENEVALLRGDIGFLELLGDELTRPILPHAAAIDYTPSQYLCEFIKECGFDGVMYRSSVGDGVNIALFNPECTNAESVSKRRVSRVLVELENDMIDP